MEEKKVIRKQVFAARKAHTDQQIDDWSRKIAETVTALPEYSNSRRILAYADYNHEVMTKYIIEAAWNDGKEVAVPKVVGQDMVCCGFEKIHGDDKERFFAGYSCVIMMRLRIRRFRCAECHSYHKSAIPSLSAQRLRI